MRDYLEKFEKMRIAGKLAAKTLDMLTANIKPGVTTEFIDKLSYEFIRDNGAHSAPLFYRGFKKSLCTSLNHVVCHGIPTSDRILIEGDALNVDVTAIVDGHYGDTSRMFCVGKTPVKVNNLIDATYESMMRAIKLLKPGLRLGDIGYEIQSFVEKKGYSVVRDFCGHGISTIFHEPPNVLHYGKKNTGLELRPGMTSSDVLDTSLNIQLVQSGKILLADIDQILKVLKKQAKKYKYTPCMGRSHGIHAEPITFGLKLASFYEEFKRNRKRLVDAIDEISTCAISGAVGTFANINPNVEKHVAKKLGLKVEPYQHK